MENGLPEHILKAYGKMLDAVTELQAVWVKEFQRQEAFTNRLYGEIQDLDDKYETLRKRWDEDVKKMCEYRDRLLALEELRRPNE